MAHYEHLPLYRKTMDLAVYLENVVRGFARYQKYALGADLRRLSKELVTLVIKANSRKEKTTLVTDLRDKSEEMKQLIVIGKETKAFRSFREFERAAALS